VVCHIHIITTYNQPCLYIYIQSTSKSHHLIVHIQLSLSALANTTTNNTILDLSLNTSGVLNNNNMSVLLYSRRASRTEGQPRDGGAPHQRSETASSVRLSMAGDEPQPRCGG
jgi:hypothetical protein